jgi:hypothetical protein
MFTSAWSRAGLAVILIAGVVPLPISVAEQGGQWNRCMPLADSWNNGTGTCAGYGECTVTFTWMLTTGMKDCEGCCVYYNVTLVCPGASISEPYTACAQCSGTTEFVVNCPMGDPLGTYFMACKSCNVW